MNNFNLLLKTIVLSLIFSILIVSLTSCNSNSDQSISQKSSDKGNSFFLMGNDYDPDITIDNIIDESELRLGGYVIIIPTSFNINNKTAIKLKKQFNEQQILAVHILNLNPKTKLKNTDIITFENASVICFVGGNRNQFVQFANDTHLIKHLSKASENGAVITGIGRGATILGEFYFTFEYSDKKSIMLKKGLGLIKQISIDSDKLLLSNANMVYKELKLNKLNYIALSSNSVLLLEKNEIKLLSNAGTEFVSAKLNHKSLNINNKNINY